MNSCLAIMVKIRHGHGFRLLSHCFKVQINSVVRFMAPGRRLSHVIPMTPISVQRTPRFGRKMINVGHNDQFWPYCAQIMTVCAFRLLQKHFKVIIDLWWMFVKPWMVFARKFVMQTHRYLWKWYPNCAIWEQKMNSCPAIMVKIRHGHTFSLLPNCSKF